MAKIDGRILTLGALTLLIILVVLAPMLTKTSSYNLPMFNTQGSANMVGDDNEYGRRSTESSDIVQDSEPQGQTNVASSLLPKEIPSTEDFASFSPETIMAGQNYLDPRAQIGYPETLGGVLRNANYDVRSEPVNPRNPVSIFNNSTIVPDLMRPKFEIGR